MSFLTGVFQSALDGDIKPSASVTKSYDIPPGALPSAYTPLTSSLHATNSTRSYAHRFPISSLSSVQTILNKADTNSLLLVRQLGPTSFTVKKHTTGRDFNVSVGVTRSCNCPECDTGYFNPAKDSGKDGNMKVCTVTLFVLLKVLMVPATSPLLFKREWTSRETDAVIAGRRALSDKLNRQNYMVPYKGTTMRKHKKGEDATMYDDEYDGLYDYNPGYGTEDVTALGGTQVTGLTVKDKTWTVKEMRDYSVAKLASMAASRGGSAGPSVLLSGSMLDSLDGMMPPVKKGLYATVKRSAELQSNGVYLPADSVLVESTIMPPELPQTDRSDSLSEALSSPPSPRSSASLASSINPSLTVSYPFFITGGRKVIANGCVLPPGMLIRHPSMLHAKKFRHGIKEFLYVWDTTKDRGAKEMLSNKIRGMWIKNTTFKEWAGHVYKRNVWKAMLLTKARIRITVVMDNGSTVDVCVSPLVTGNEVLALAVRRRKMVSKGVNRRAKDLALVYEGSVIDERRTLWDAGVEERSTLRMVHPLAINKRGEGYLQSGM